MARDLPNYIQWYSTTIYPKLSPADDHSEFCALFEELLRKQDYKCSITGEVFCLDQCYHQRSPWLKKNNPQKTPWLPAYELVVWPLRSIKFPINNNMSNNVHNVPRIIIDEDDEEYY